MDSEDAVSPPPGAGSPEQWLDLSDLSLAELNRRMVDGEVTSAALVEAALARAAAVEPWLRAFAWLDPARARHLAAAADATTSRARAAATTGAGLGVLHGVPVGVKDIVDTAG